MTRSSAKQWFALPSAIRTATWFTILTVPPAVAPYYRIFSGFAGWDDEGAFMMTVKQYLAGANSTKILPLRGRRHSGRGGTGVPRVCLQGKRALRVTYVSGHAGGGADSCREGRSGGLSLAGG